MIQLTEKQKQAISYLTDATTTEVLYGGSAGGGKSFVGCLWVIDMCMKHNGCRGLIGRSKLKRLKQTTLVTFWQVLHAVGLTVKDYKYNSVQGTILFRNGSEVILRDLFAYPSDPNFDELGSLEISFAFVDECNQVTKKCIQVLKSRIRYNLHDFEHEKPKLFMTCNPALNWVKEDFFTPWKLGKLKERRAFIPALPSENPHLPQSYIDELQLLDDEQLKSRLLEGNWDYIDDPTKLFDFDAVSAMWNNVAQGVGKYITADVARFGRDSSVIMVWYGFSVVELVAIESSTIVELANKIKDLCKSHVIGMNRVLVDGDGVGGGCADILGCKEFNNGSRPNDSMYSNMKAEVYFGMSELVTDGLVSVQTTKHAEEFKRDLNDIKMKPRDSEGKAKLESKKEHKTRTGRSPDFADCFAMRYFFELNKKKTTHLYGFV